MQALLLKDFYVIIKQLKLFLLFIPIMALAGGTALATISILLGAVLPMTAIAYDEHSKWNELAIMMPYSKKDLVISKYLLGYICMFSAAVLVVLSRFFLQIFQMNPESYTDILIGICSGLTFIAINTPILLKFGSEKGRFVFILSMVLVGASSGFFNQLDKSILLSLKNISPLFILLVILFLNFISIQISLKITRKQN